MPTSLTYIILSTRGYEPWRPAADMGTSTSGSPRGPLPDFHGPAGKSRRRWKCVALRYLYPTSLRKHSRGHDSSYRKENSSGISRRRLRVLLGYPDELSLLTKASIFEIGSASWFRNMNRIPFRTRREAYFFTNSHRFAALNL